MVFPANCLQVLRKFIFLKKALPPINSFRDSAEFVEAFRTEIDFQPTGTTLDSTGQWTDTTALESALFRGKFFGKMDLA